MRDCSFSRNIWQHIGFTDTKFFVMDGAADWIREGMKGCHATTFAAGLWWVWLCQNAMCMNNEQMPIHKVTSNIMNSIENIKLAFPSNTAAHLKGISGGIITTLMAIFLM
jgi:hypothetical protein